MQVLLQKGVQLLLFHWRQGINFRQLRLQAQNELDSVVLLPVLWKDVEVFLCKHQSNPLAQSGRVGSLFCNSEARWAPSTSFWEIVEVAQRSSTAGSGRILIMKSLSPVSYSTSQIQRGVSSLSESSAYSGEGPDQQMLTALASIFFCNTCSFCIMWHPSH